MLAPVRSEDDFEMKVVGRPGRTGRRLLRSGPNPRFDPSTYYGFLGDGMVHGFFLEPNKDRGRVRFSNGHYHKDWRPFELM